MSSQLTAHLPLASFPHFASSRSNTIRVLSPPPSSVCFASCFAHLVPERTTTVKLTRLGSPGTQSPLETTMPASLCPCNLGSVADTSMPSIHGLLCNSPPMALSVQPQLSSGLWLTTAQCLAGGLFGPLLGSATSFLHGDSSPESLQFEGCWAVFFWYG